MPDAPAEAESQPDSAPASNPDTPEPSQGEATVTVENGRRRGRRRVMKKKKVKDEDGYLGKQIYVPSYRRANMSVQLQGKKLSGSRSRKTNQKLKSSNLHPPSRRAAQRESLPQRRAKEALPVSSRKLDRLRKRIPISPTDMRRMCYFVHSYIHPNTGSPPLWNPTAGVVLPACVQVLRRNAT